VSETSHFGAGRGRWIREVSNEVGRAREAGVCVDGLCLYPIIDRPDWDDLITWHHSGLWDININNGLKRILCQPMADALLRAQKKVKNCLVLDTV